MPNFFDCNNFHDGLYFILAFMPIGLPRCRRQGVGQKSWHYLLHEIVWYICSNCLQIAWIMNGAKITTINVKFVKQTRSISININIYLSNIHFPNFRIYLLIHRPPYKIHLFFRQFTNWLATAIINALIHPHLSLTKGRLCFKAQHKIIHF